MNTMNCFLDDISPSADEEIFHSLSTNRPLVISLIYCNTFTVVSSFLKSLILPKGRL
jgi:hypothetical protein